MYIQNCFKQTKTSTSVFLKHMCQNKPNASPMTVTHQRQIAHTYTPIAGRGRKIKESKKIKERDALVDTQGGVEQTKTSASVFLEHVCEKKLTLR